MEWETIAGLALAAVVSIWALVKGIVKLTPNTEDDEIVAKADPYVEQGASIVRKVLGEDEDSDNKPSAG